MFLRRLALPLLACWLPAAAAASDCGTLDPLRWLIGDWVADGSRQRFHESWEAAGPGTLEGTGAEHSKPEGRVVSLESLRLVQMSGGVFYIAKVAHNALPVAFRLVACEPGRFVFENPAHGFPRKLVYTRHGEDALTVDVSDGGDKGFTLEFRRAAAARSAEAAILAAEDARFAAMIAADRGGLRRWLADGLAYVHSTGRVEGKEQLIDAIVAGRLRYLSSEPMERRVIPLAGDSALVLGLGRFRATAGDATLDATLRYLAAYVRESGDWRLTGWQSLRVETK